MKRLIVIFILLLLAPLVLAQSDHHCQGNSCNDSGSSGGVVDVSLNSELSTITSFESSSRAYALSGGDMDINDCLATESYLFGLYQRVKPNYLCMAEVAQAKGEYERAAEFRCAYWGVRRVQGGKKQCIERLKYDNPIMLPTTSSTVSKVEDDDEGQREFEQMQAQITELEYQIEQRPEPQRIYIDAGTARRAAAKAALKGDKK